MEELYINREKFDNYEDFYKNYTGKRQTSLFP